LFGYDIDVTTMVRLVDEPDDARRPTQYWLQRYLEQIV
jgi:hypothetical protein